jgi:hypothetical protein
MGRERRQGMSDSRDSADLVGRPDRPHRPHRKGAARGALGALAFATLVVGCMLPAQEEHPPDTIVWHGDVTFTAEERTLVETGANWLKDYVRPRHAIVWDAPHPAETEECTPGTIARRTKSIGAVCYCSYFDNRTCISLGVADGYLLDALAAHELTHASGVLDHAPHGLLMRPYNPVRDWSDSDQALCEKYWACP